ncbi:MAG: thiamine phosphate synthase [Pseudazoarcus pumilus]|nr:thiamine phosphate synthase [Pseudazoarcus pumilus]
MTEKLSRGLYLVTPDCRDTGELLACLHDALAGHPAIVQYRNKLAPVEARREQAAAAAALAHAAGALFIVNDSVELALDVGADGVHIGRDDGDIAAARAAIGPNRILGVSCYDDWARAEQAVTAGADYIAFGAMFSSSVKPDAVQAPIELVRRAKAQWGVPVCCIGGITLDNAPQLVEAGADLLAVISDVFKAPDPAARAAAIQALYD